MNIYGKGNPTKLKKQKFGKSVNDTVKLEVDTVNDTVNDYRITNVYYRIISYQNAILKALNITKLKTATENYLHYEIHPRNIQNQPFPSGPNVLVKNCTRAKRTAKEISPDFAPF